MTPAGDDNEHLWGQTPAPACVIADGLPHSRRSELVYPKPRSLDAKNRSHLAGKRNILPTR
jgi:hypothetical protein